jgi:hypothetical protein
MLLSIATNFATVTPWVILSSMGYHTWLQTQHANCDECHHRRKSGSILGHVSAFGELRWLSSHDINGGRILSQQSQLCLGVLVDWAGSGRSRVGDFQLPSLCDGLPHAITTKREPIVINKDYRFYYMLNLLDGGRQQIFFSFGLWVLAHKYNLDVTHLTMILIAVNLVNTLIGRRVGKLIDRFGERPMLAAARFCMSWPLAGYAFVDNIWVLVDVIPFIASFSLFRGLEQTRTYAKWRHIPISHRRLPWG